MVGASFLKFNIPDWLCWPTFWPEWRPAEKIVCWPSAIIEYTWQRCIYRRGRISVDVIARTCSTAHDFVLACCRGRQVPIGVAHGQPYRCRRGENGRRRLGLPLICLVARNPGLLGRWRHVTRPVRRSSYLPYFATPVLRRVYTT